MGNKITYTSALWDFKKIIDVDCKIVVVKNKVPH